MDNREWIPVQNKQKADTSSADGGMVIEDSNPKFDETGRLRSGRLAQMIAAA